MCFDAITITITVADFIVADYKIQDKKSRGKVEEAWNATRISLP